MCDHALPTATIALHFCILQPLIAMLPPDLGVEGVIPEWSDDDYDSMYVLRVIFYFKPCSACFCPCCSGCVYSAIAARMIFCIFRCSLTSFIFPALFYSYVISIDPLSTAVMYVRTANHAAAVFLIASLQFFRSQASKFSPGVIIVRQRCSSAGP